MYQLPTFLEKSKKKSIIVTVCTCRYQLTALNNDHCLVKSCDAQRTIPITKLASIFKLLIDVNGIKLLINDVQTIFVSNDGSICVKQTVYSEWYFT